MRFLLRALALLQARSMIGAICMFRPSLAWPDN